MTQDAGIKLRRLNETDLAAFAPRSRALARYLKEQAGGGRSVVVVEVEGVAAGYVTLLWSADDPVFREQGIPEISDLWVDPVRRRRGLGTVLLDEAERQAAARTKLVGLNVGLHSGYGSAQRLYARRGYLPDGSGVVIAGEVVPEGATICLDDQPVVTLRMTRAIGGLG